VTGVNVRVGACIAAIAALCSAPSAQAQSTMVALWHMDETSGSTMADAVGGNTGTLHSVTTGVPGALGTAYDFDGKSAYVSVPSAGSLNPGSSPMEFSVSVHLRSRPPTGSNLDYDILRKGIASTKGGMYKLEVPHSGTPVCRFAGSLGDVRVTGAKDVADGRWHTVTCARTATGVSVAVDGGSPRVRSGATGTISNTANLVIGAKPGSDYTNGTIDEVSVSVG
jgi:concanavalin A-like lectin/glucanase superfamily protein